MDHPKTPPTPEIEDISAGVADLKPSDRIYRSASGYRIKVRTLRQPGEDPDRLHFRISGSLLGDDRKTVTHAGRPFICSPHLVTVQSETRLEDDGMDAALEAGRRLVVTRVETAAIHHAKAAALTGVGAA